MPTSVWVTDLVVPGTVHELFVLGIGLGLAAGSCFASTGTKNDYGPVPEAKVQISNPVTAIPAVTGPAGQS